MGKIFGWSSSAEWRGTIDDVKSVFGDEDNRLHPSGDSVVGTIVGLAVDEGTKYTAVSRRGTIVAAITGLYRWQDKQIAEVFDREGPAKALIAAFQSDGPELTKKLSGSFSLAVGDDATGKLLIAVDPFSTERMAYADFGRALVFGTDTSLLRRHPLWDDELDDSAILSYFFFHNVPLPRSIYKHARRVSPAHYLNWNGLEVCEVGYYSPEFADGYVASGNRLEGAQLLSLLTDEVNGLSAGRSVGTFLSGGLDSSTITGLLSETQQSCHSFSIGFEADRYDELEFAGVVANHFGTNHHQYYVTPEDIIESSPRIAGSFSEPFGNASAVPTYFCARLAKHHGMEILLAGDGGDELFGGNERYAYDRYFQLYDRVPGFARRILEAIFLSPWPGQILGDTKPAKYLRKANTPLPDRLYDDNFINTIGAARIFDDDFLKKVELTQPMSHVREQYERCKSKEPLNKQLALDWHFILACSDLPKVSSMCELAGVEVGFPFLGNPVVDFSTRLAVREKVNGSDLRVFFRNAVGNFLPKQTLQKSKHGFGLPFGVWLTSHSQLREFAFDVLSDLKRRRIVSPTFIDQLTGELHQKHPQYYGVMVWLLLMFELFLVSRQE